MKKSIATAFLLSACVVSSFAQDASTLGARRVAERDIAYAKLHPVAAQQTAVVMHKTKKHQSRRHLKHHAVAPKATK